MAGEVRVGGGGGRVEGVVKSDREEGSVAGEGVVKTVSEGGECWGERE